MSVESRVQQALGQLIFNNLVQADKIEQLEEKVSSLLNCAGQAKEPIKKPE